MVRSLVDNKQDPTQFHWFDVCGYLTDQTGVSQDPLFQFRPPFDKCIICWEGKSAANNYLEMHMQTYGSDPQTGITLSVWRAKAGRAPISSPVMFYIIEDGSIKYGTVNHDENIDHREASMILGFTSQWLNSLSRKSESYIPIIKPTFTNTRKIKHGKPPLYEWRTVIVEPTQVKQEHLGGTHASPRMHERRGHLRRLQSGKNVWVKSCKVGDSNKGFVFHDYKIV